MRYIVEVPEDNKHYEIYTPIKDGIKELVTCADCAYCSQQKFYRRSLGGACAMHGIITKLNNFCSFAKKK